MMNHLKQENRGRLIQRSGEKLYPSHQFSDLFHLLVEMQERNIALPPNLFVFTEALLRRILDDAVALSANDAFWRSLPKSVAYPAAYVTAQARTFRRGIQQLVRATQEGKLTGQELIRGASGLAETITYQSPDEAHQALLDASDAYERDLDTAVPSKRLRQRLRGAVERCNR